MIQTFYSFSLIVLFVHIWNKNKVDSFLLSLDRNQSPQKQGNILGTILMSSCERKTNKMVHHLFNNVVYTYR